VGEVETEWTSSRFRLHSLDSCYSRSALLLVTKLFVLQEVTCVFKIRCSVVCLKVSIRYESLPEVRERCD